MNWKLDMKMLFEDWTGETGIIAEYKNFKGGFVEFLENFKDMGR